MAQEKPYPYSALFIGVLQGRAADRKMFIPRLEKLFGPIAEITDSIPFSFTDYYNPEMGEGIERYFIVFNEPVDPSRLADIKKATNALELEFAADGKRCFNLDPGLVSEYSVILATCKNRAHRIPLKDGIYGETTLIFRNRHFEGLDWTYADYRSLSGLFERFRKDFLAKLNGK